MANDEQRAILKSGVKKWNAWREENPGVRPDLIRAILSNANLIGADLENASKSQGGLR